MTTTHHDTDATEPPEATPAHSNGSPDATDATDVAELHVAYPADPPAFEAFDVRTLTPTTLLGVPCTVAVVGQSHVLTAPTLGYHEVCSCQSRPDDVAETVRLDPGATGQVAEVVGAVALETTVEVRPLSAFPGPDDATLAYRFAPDAWTTIAVADRGDEYETYHTYPEHDAAVYTATALSRRVDASEATTEPKPGMGVSR